VNCRAIQSGFGVVLFGLLTGCSSGPPLTEVELAQATQALVAWRAARESGETILSAAPEQTGIHSTDGRR
jgi:hypothetical protein